MGGTNLRAAAVGEDGTMLDKVAGSTPMQAGPDAAVADMVQLIQGLQ
jgi:predicted NBD/HSP70 family sugar kinase